MNTKYLDEIISMVANFDYFVNSKGTDKNKASIEVKRPYFSVKNRNKNLDELLQIISNLKGSVLSEKNTHESKINELYELIKTKLNKDLSLFNFMIVTKFIKGYTSTDSDKLDKSFKVLFDIILKEVEGELKKILPNFDLLPNLFYNKDELKEIIKPILAEQGNHEDKAENIKPLLNIYIHAILKNRSLLGFDKQLFVFERILAEQVAEFKQKDKNKYLLKSLPEALLQDDPKSKIRSFIYLYFNDYINELELQVNDLSNRLNVHQNSTKELTNKVNQLSEKSREKDNLITQLTEQLEEKNEKINKQQEELDASINRMEYEVNKYEIQLQNLRPALINRVQRNMQMDLDGLTRFANRLPQNDGDILKMYITSIHQFLSTL